MSLSIKKKAIKKAVSVVTMVATVVCMSGIASFSVTSLAIADVVDGNLIKSNATNEDGTPTLASLDVYIVKLVGTKKFKRLVLNPEVFNSYGHLNWTDIQTVSESVMDEYTTAALVRVDTDPDEKVYALAPENDTGKKSWVNMDGADFLAVSGSEDGDSIYTINSTDAGSYSAVGDILLVVELEEFYADGTLPPVDDVEAGLTVALSSETPAAGTVLLGSDGVLYTKANVTASEGEVTVTGMKVKRSGFGAYSDFTSIWLVVDGVRRGSVKTMNSADVASLLFSAETQKVVVPDGETKVFEVWASVAASSASASNALSISEVTTASAVNGLPVTGNEMTNSTAAAPDVTLDEATIGNTAEIGNTNVVVAKFKVDNDESNEIAIFEAITFKSITKASTTRAYTTDFTNFRLYDNSGNMVAGPIEMGSDNYLRFTLDTPFEVAAGTSKLEWFQVKADVLDGAGRTLNLSVEGTYDVVVRGGTNMVRADINDTYADANEYVTLSASDLSIAVDSTTNPIAADIVENTTVVLLAGNITAAKGSVDAEALTVTLAGTDMDFNATAEFDNLRVYVNDLLVSETSTFLDSGDDSAAATGETSVYAAFTDTFTVDGVAPFRVEIDVKDLKSPDTSTIIKATITGTTITGTTADGTAVTGTGTAAGNDQTVAVPGYKIYKSATPVSVSKVLGSQDVEFLGFDIKANNTTNVTVNKIKFQWNITEVAGTIWTAGQNDVTNLELFSVTTGEKVAGPFNLDASTEYEFTGLGLDIDSNGSKYILKADLASSITGADNTDYGFFTIIASEGDANNNTYAGDNSAGTDIADSGVATEINYNAATKITLASGTLTVTLANDTATSSQLVATSTDNSLASWKLLAANEDVQVKKFRVGLTTGPAGEDEISRIGLYEGTTKLAEAYGFNGAYTEFDITSQDFVVAAGTGNARYLTMKVDLTSTTDTVLDSGESVAGVLIDLTSWGTINQVAPKSGSTTDGFAFGTGGTSSGNGVIADLTVTMTDSSTIYVGDIIKIGSEQMYVSANNAGTEVLTVVRGFNGTVAADYTSVASDITVARSLEGNDHKAYGAKVVVTEGGLASGSFAASSSYKTVYKFTVTSATNSVEDVTLESVKISLSQSTGIGSLTASDYFIGSLALYNGAGTKISELVGGTAMNADGTCGVTGVDEELCVSTDYVVFDETTKTAKNTAGGTGLAEPVSSGGETYSVKAKVYSTVATNDTLQLQIADLGTIGAAGDLSWSDSIITTPFITWVGDDVNASVIGPQFKN